MPLCEQIKSEKATTRQFVITIADGAHEYPLSLAENEWVDLSDYTCRRVTKKDLNKIKAADLDNESYASIEEILRRGFEIHIWKHKAH